MTSITIIKRDYHSEEVLRYQGEILQHNTSQCVVSAIFQGTTRDLGYVILKTGDIFIEWFYTQRWYNIFRIEDVTSGQLKGWYCNFTRPAEITSTTIAADDLALDLFVQPNGETLLLDEDEYQTLTLPQNEKDAVREALIELRQKIEQRLPPFDEVVN
jgi:protein associated with RNAse G/E